MATGFRVSRILPPSIDSASNNAVRSASWPVSARVASGSCSAPELSITSGGLPLLKRGWSCWRMSVMPACLISAALNFFLYSDSWNLA